jgi:hypothetical protein
MIFMGNLQLSAAAYVREIVSSDIKTPAVDQQGHLRLSRLLFVATRLASRV